MTTKSTSQRTEVTSSSKNGMITHTLAGTRTASGEPPRSTAYYYADLEKLKKTKSSPEAVETKDLQNELSEYVEANEVINDGAVREVPPLRDRKWSLPEYNTPENGRKFEETYSTAGTFPMPEPKEKEPLLAELEVVGRLPLTQLDSSPGVRRSRSWYLCCPNVPDEEISRESSWRYSSLRPVTAPPAPGQNGFHQMIASQTSGRDDVNALKAERDALARALAAERQRAATAARAHDARLAELHGVIAELVRRRAAQKQSTAIPEEELSDECESTTQPAGELDNDADQSRTEQISSSSALSPAELPTPQEPRPETRDADARSAHDAHSGAEPPCAVQVSPPPELEPDTSAQDTSLDLSERDSELCLSTARCCQQARADSGGSCERERGSPALYPSPKVLYAAGGGARQAKLASRVRLRRTDDSDSNHVEEDQAWRVAASSLALGAAAHADLTDAMLRPRDDCSWRLRFLQSESSAAVARGALSRCADACRRLYCACGELEAACTAVCEALRAADRALEAYDVLLALAETANLESSGQRAAAEAVAWQLLRRLQLEQASAPAAPLLSPGPWLHQPDPEPVERPAHAWGAPQEALLRRHAATLKAHTVALRQHANNPRLYSHHDIDEDDIPKTDGVFSMAEMEAAVMLEDLLTARAAAACRRPHEHKTETSRSRRRRERHWREAHASETDL